MGKPSGVNSDGVFIMFKRRLSPKRWKFQSSQRPEDHIMSEYRYALGRYPCCGRVIRVRIFQRAGKWYAENGKLCPRCHRLWRLDARLTKHGIARSLRFYTPVKWPKNTPTDAS